MKTFLCDYRIEDDSDDAVWLPAGQWKRFGAVQAETIQQAMRWLLDHVKNESGKKAVTVRSLGEML